MSLLLIFPIALAAIGLCYIGWAWASLYSGRIRTLPKTYVEKARLPVTYWLLFLGYWIFGLAAVAFALGVGAALIQSV
jgi:hypothetical protein